MVVRLMGKNATLENTKYSTKVKRNSLVNSVAGTYQLMDGVSFSVVDKKAPKKYRGNHNETSGRNHFDC